MKFATGIQDDRHVLYVSDGGAPRDLAETCEHAGLTGPGSMRDLVRLSMNDSGYLAKISESIAKVRSIDVASIDWLAPIPDPSKILGVAFNNKELMRQAHRDPGVPNFFLKPPSALQGHRKPIVIDPAWGAVIPEPEVCAVIGRRAKNITAGEALDYVFGFTIHNDVTSHGLKFQKDSIAVTYDPDMALPEFFGWRNLHGDDDRDVYYVYHTRSKGTDTFGPMGPWLTTRDEIVNPNDLNVVADLDGEIFARDNTSNYRFSIEACLAEASRYFTLEPGDLISFGTTGKGEGRFPRGHKSLLMGQVTGTVGIAIDGLGRLENPIVHQPMVGPTEKIQNPK